jgi:hypothetical protein
MTGTIELLDDLMALTDGFFPSDRTSEVSEAHECDGCGEVTTHTDLWAKHSETGEELWLCMSCGE